MTPFYQPGFSFCIIQIETLRRLQNKSVALTGRSCILYLYIAEKKILRLKTSFGKILIRKNPDTEKPGTAIVLSPGVSPGGFGSL